MDTASKEEEALSLAVVATGDTMIAVRHMVSVSCKFYGFSMRMMVQSVEASEREGEMRRSSDMDEKKKKN